ncbi:MAG TPA: hypothetical protein DCY07_07040 [Rhodospirillaceae bacterium]|nr:hypothetical protein [Rhodospirillaceae bacterium]
MTIVSSSSMLGNDLTGALGAIGRKKTPTRDEIFAAQEAKEALKAEESQQSKTEFLKFAKMSPAERLRAAFLEEHGLTEESLAQLPKEERMKIEEEIKKLIKTKLGLDDIQTGQLADVSA